ncbi:MAG: hypothetical protein F6K56_23600 [Moorea sp. SIO3G5]|nr:hypothetical protein [Moorena sp. SIO3G5]
MGVSPTRYCRGSPTRYCRGSPTRYCRGSPHEQLAFHGANSGADAGSL